MSSRTYSTVANVYNGDASGPNFSFFGTGAINTLPVHTNGWTHIGANNARIAVDWVNDGIIPTGSSITNVTVSGTAAYFNNSKSYFPYIRYEPGSPTYRTTPPTSSGFGSFETFGPTTPLGFATDPNNAAWTVANFFNARFGIENSAFVGDAQGFMSAFVAAVTFTLPAPVATTTAATGVTGVAAQLNGTVNPNGANATYPVSYRFEWGTSVAYGNQTTLVLNQTGTSDIAVNAAISGLAGNSTYHFRLVALNADVTTNGADQTFFTGGGDRALLIF